MVAKKGELTAKQARFVEEYCIDWNATQAAIRAGYSEKTAREVGKQNISKLYVKAAIDKIMSEKSSAAIASQNEVLEFLTKTLRGELEEECVVVEGQGEGVSRATKVKKQVTPNDRWKAANMLAKRYGLDKLVIEIQEHVIKVVDDIGE